jgi:hypothetical protein
MVLGISKATGALGSLIKAPETIAIATSVLLVPIVQPFIDSIIARIPFLNSHRTLALIVAGVFIFIVASKVRSNIFRSVVIGIAGSLFILGISPLINQFVRR